MSALRLLRRLFGPAPDAPDVPLVRLGQGDYRRDLYPEDFGMPANTDTVDLRFLIREPADVYHARGKDYLSSHALNEFRRCPLLYRKRELGLVAERDSTAFLIGRAAHTLILEGRQRYEREYAIGRGPLVELLKLQLKHVDQRRSPRRRSIPIAGPAAHDLPSAERASAQGDELRSDVPRSLHPEGRPA